MHEGVTLKQLAHTLSVSYTGGPVTIPGSISIDSRTLHPGQLFVALRGQHTDGHRYVEAAAQAGASACIVETPLTTALPHLVVPDARQAMLQLGTFYRQRFQGTVFGVTGSCGKTSVKEMLGCILNNIGPTLITSGNLNNQLGVPITLSQLTPQHRFAIIEMGTSFPGEIAQLTHTVHPNISLITNAEATHLEHLHSIEGVAKEKSAILDQLTQYSAAVLNKDSQFFNHWYTKVQRQKARLFSFSLNDPHASIYASNIEHHRNKTHFFIHHMAKKWPIQLHFLGTHQVMNALAAAAAALTLNTDIHHITLGLQKAKPYMHRGQCHIGKKGATIIDETYSANPTATRAAINTLATCKGHTIFVLGDMLELGQETIVAHKKIGHYARQHHINELITYGHFSQQAAATFGKHATHFVDQQTLNHYLEARLSPNVVLLVKGSRAMAMDKIVAYCTEIESETIHTDA